MSWNQFVFAFCVFFSLIINSISESTSLNVSAKFTEGNGIGFRHGYSTVELMGFSPRLYCGRIQPFLDIRGSLLNNGRGAANVGIGGRYLDLCRNVVYGANLYYDFRQGHNKGYNQIGFGLEMLSPKFDVRCNGYAVVGDNRNTLRTRLFLYPGDFFAFYKERELAASGADAEIGKWIKRKGLCELFGIYIAAGPYYFHTRSPHDAWGGKLRAIAQIGNLFSFELRTSYDRVFHGRVQGIFTFVYPFGFNKCCDTPTSFKESFLQAIAKQPVVRNDLIVLDQSYRWRANF